MSCCHDDTVPVDVRNHSTGGTDTVAHLCTHCLAQLPANWTCTACDWDERSERRLCDPHDTTRRICTRPCKEHA